MKTVGVVGTGAMGLAMVERFLTAGLRASVYDVSGPALERAVALGAVAGTSAAEVAAASDSVSMMVRSDDQMLESVLGSNGVLSGLLPGGLLLLHSTIHPGTTRAIAEVAQARGVDLADACIAGVPAVVRAGQAVCLAGGDTALIERITPHLLLLVRRVIHMGPLGSGNVAKIVRNLVNLTDRLVLHEGLQIMHASGVPTHQGLQMLELIYANRDLDDEARGDRVRPEGNLFDTILPLARRLADDHGLQAPLTRALAAADVSVAPGQ
jgi:3-hydroxyisobutyrate dehydrogenase-like beta-hydroxyacid dehydrogenase